jgi:hypothetical protein
MKRRNSSHSGRFKDLAVVIGGIDIAATRAFKKPSIRISCDLSARSGILLKNLHRTNKMINFCTRGWRISKNDSDKSTPIIRGIWHGRFCVAPESLNSFASIVRVRLPRSSSINLLWIKAILLEMCVVCVRRAIPRRVDRTREISHSCVEKS